MPDAPSNMIISPVVSSWVASRTSDDGAGPIRVRSEVNVPSSKEGTG